MWLVVHFLEGWKFRGVLLCGVRTSDWFALCIVVTGVRYAGGKFGGVGKCGSIENGTQGVGDIVVDRRSIIFALSKSICVLRVMMWVY